MGHAGDPTFSATDGRLIDADSERTARRLSAIDTIGLVDGPPDEVFARAARLASALLGTTVVHTTLVLDDRQFYPSHVGLPEPVASSRESPLDYSFCKHVVEAESALSFDDTSGVPMLADNRAVAEFAVRTYAGVPLRAPDGTVVGTVCALDFAPRTWTDDELVLLGDVADILHTELRLRQEVDRLRDARQQALAVGIVGTALHREAGRLRDGAAADEVASTLDDFADRLASLDARSRDT